MQEKSPYGADALLSLISDPKMKDEDKHKKIKHLIKSSRRAIEKSIDNFIIDNNKIQWPYRIDKFCIFEGKNPPFQAEASSQINLGLVATAIQYKCSLGIIRLFIEYDIFFQKNTVIQKDKQSEVSEEYNLSQEKLVFALASAMGRSDVLEHLLDEKIITNINSTYEYNVKIPFFSRAPRVRYRKVSYIKHTYNATIKISPLELAVRNGHSDVVMLLLKRGSNPNVVSVIEENQKEKDAIINGLNERYSGEKHLVEWKNIQETCLLSIAVYRNNLDIVRILFRYGEKFRFSEDVNFKKYRNEVEEKISELKGIKNSPIVMAIEDENFEMLKLLLMQLACSPEMCEVGDERLFLSSLEQLFSFNSEIMKNLFNSFVCWKKAQTAYHEEKYVRVRQYLSEAYDNNSGFVLLALERDILLFNEFSKSIAENNQVIEQDNKKYLYLKMFFEELFSLIPLLSEENRKILREKLQNILLHFIASSVFWENTEEQIKWLEKHDVSQDLLNTMNVMSGHKSCLSNTVVEGSSGTSKEIDEIPGKDTEGERTIEKGNSSPKIAPQLSLVGFKPSNKRKNKDKAEEQESEDEEGNPKRRKTGDDEEQERKETTMTK